MSGPFDEGTTDGGTDWPDHDLADADAWGEGPWNVKRDGERRRPSTAEQAVPWLIGLVLALTGMVMVMSALIFSTGGEVATASPTPSANVTPTPAPSPTPEPTPTVAATATPVPTPQFGALELLYRARRSNIPAVLVHDFSTTASPAPALTDSRGIDRFDWSPNGTWGAGLAEGALLLIQPGTDPRELTTGIDGIGISPDSRGLWAVRVTHASGSTDRAELLRMEYPTGEMVAVHAFNYPTPVTFQESNAREKAFDDDGGFNRVMELADGRVAIVILGAPAVYMWDPETAAAGTLEVAPTLWAPNVSQRIEVREASGRTTLILRNAGGTQIAGVTFNGLVSHLRWSPTSVQVVFTITTSSSSAPQDLYVWNLGDGVQPLRLTQDGVSGSAVWRGAPIVWLP